MFSIYFLEFDLLDVCCVSRTESRPLLLLVGIVVELGCKGDRRATGGQFSSASLECLSDRLAERFAVEVECAGKGFEIIEVLHSAVGDTELDHDLKFFGDNGFFGIGEKVRIGSR